MTEFQRGMGVALRIALDVEKELVLSPAHFNTYKEYLGYRAGVKAYAMKIGMLLDN